MDETAILVTAGAFALIAAIAGGRLKGGTWEIGVLRSTARQLILGATGVVLIAVGLGVKGGNPFARSPTVAAAIGTGVDFRSSNVQDSFQLGTNRGYLILVASVRVRNSQESARPVTWEDTVATLDIGGRATAFRSYYFINGDLSRANWLGRERNNAEPVTIPPGQTAQRDIVFMPENAGEGALMWDEFVRFVLSDRRDAVVRFTVHLSDGVEPISTTCSARTDHHLAAVRERATITQRSEPNLKLDCRRS